MQTLMEQDEGEVLASCLRVLPDSQSIPIFVLRQSGRTLSTQLKALVSCPLGINISTLAIDHIPDILTITHLSHMPYGDGVEPMFYNCSYIDYGPKQSQHLQHIKDYPERKLCPMSKNINLIYCLKKNKHRSYTGDYQKFLRRRQALGEAGLEYGVFKDKSDALAFLGIASGKHQAA